ncbi:hypothetical protein F8388_001852 [Cannabis sativa]|uniref:Uncharacterized protein n=1 Tax=Cannabis sativa TaxID=3483 RepID=A0A7J6FI44_CANSA|nr:hypothetical protein G4B88_026063 [Cannabis sativa]KAF4369430.1 hypothetical protein F8388_001852 [Cannabis sativa]
MEVRGRPCDLVLAISSFLLTRANRTASILYKNSCKEVVPSLVEKLFLMGSKLIDFSITSAFGGGLPIRVKRKNQKAVAKKASGGDGDKEDEE